MDERVLKFLQRHRIAVLTTLLTDGQPHSASLHYAFSEKPFYFIFGTEKETKKLTGLKPGGKSKASVVIGFSEEEWLTMQLDGEVTWVSDKNEMEEEWGMYLDKFTDAREWKKDPDAVILRFTPKWWRYTEVRPKPLVVISSEDNKAL